MSFGHSAQGNFGVVFRIWPSVCMELQPHVPMSLDDCSLGCEGCEEIKNRRGASESFSVNRTLPSFLNT